MAVFKSERFAVDLTTIEKPFGLLDAETQKALIEAWDRDKAIEVFSDQGKWVQPGVVTWRPEWTYRVRATPKPPAIELPWEVIDPRWKWAAMDADRRVFLYDGEPRAREDYWNAEDDFRDVDGLIIGIRINVTDWKQSLTKRPE